MNKFQKWFALKLINRRLSKLERSGIKAWKNESNMYIKRTTSPLAYIEAKHEYRRLRELRFNIETINNPWQGVFNPYFNRKPKKDKHIEEFPKFVYDVPELPPLSEEDQRWFDMTGEEFVEALDAE